MRQAVRNGGAKLIIVNDTPIRLTHNATQFIHVNPNSYDAFALAFADKSNKNLRKNSASNKSEIDDLLKTIGETEGDFVIMFGGDLSAEAQAVLANAAAKFCYRNSPRFASSVAALQ